MGCYRGARACSHARAPHLLWRLGLLRHPLHGHSRACQCAGCAVACRVSHHCHPLLPVVVVSAATGTQVTSMALPAAAPEEAVAAPCGAPALRRGRQRLHAGQLLGGARCCCQGACARMRTGLIHPPVLRADAPGGARLRPACACTARPSSWLGCHGWQPAQDLRLNACSMPRGISASRLATASLKPAAGLGALMAAQGVKSMPGSRHLQPGVGS